MKTIPQTFSSLEQYLSSFTYLLIEEARFDLFSSLEVLSQAPYIEIQSIEEIKSQDQLYLINLGIQGNSDGKKAYTPMVADIFAISELRPRHVSDLTKDERSYTIALVVKSGSGEGPLSSDKIIIKASCKVSIYTKQKKQGKSLFAVYLLSMNTYNRIWKSLDVETARNNNIINVVWAYNSMVCTKILSLHLSL